MQSGGGVLVMPALESGEQFLDSSVEAWMVAEGAVPARRRRELHPRRLTLAQRRNREGSRLIAE